MMFAKYFEYYTIISGRVFFADTLYILNLFFLISSTAATFWQSFIKRICYVVLRDLKATRYIQLLEPACNCI